MALKAVDHVKGQREREPVAGQVFVLNVTVLLKTAKHCIFHLFYNFILKNKEMGDGTFGENLF